LASESLLFPPPYHVHVDVQAAVGSLPIGLSTFTWPKGARPVTDSLLHDERARPASLGWVRWYGRHGQLLLAPGYPAGGMLAGHVVFYFTTGRVSYAISVHAWVPMLRIGGARVHRTIRSQPGPALPHVIATLKAVLGSALAPT
jgi:hypothetical protein